MNQSVEKLDKYSIVATNYKGFPGVPAIFSSMHFLDLCRLKGDQGAKKVIQQNISRTHIINCDGDHFDIDKLEDFHKLTSN